MKKNIGVLIGLIRPIMIFILLITLVICTACDEFLTLDPPSNQLNSITVFEDDLTATAAISGLYGYMINSGGFVSGGVSSLSTLGGVSADELDNNVQDINFSQFFENSLVPTNNLLPTFWNEGYAYIYQANSIIEGLEKSANVTPTLKKQLIGEAKFIRAFSHFYLVNLFGSIPYIETTDYRENTVAPRMNIDAAYENIIKDLIAAKEALPDDYSFSNGEKTRPNKFAASAMLARVYLYTNSWQNAEAEAGLVINKADLYSLNPNLDEVFLLNSNEAIWQLMPSYDTYTLEGNVFLNPGSFYYFKVSDELYNSFEVGDERKNTWIIELTYNEEPWYAMYKYKDYPESSSSLREYYMMLRLSEQYLIRAEARAKQKNITGVNSAESDLNIIRDRANLAPTTASTEEEMLNAILNERRVELFVEFGHRWLDLKRMGKADEVLSLIKPDWNSDDKLYPIPESEILVNPNMTQNDGY